jgi:putative SbcD/Mre11-related phosphoesterase
MKFLYNAPAIFHKGAIIVGDTHFGMEYKLKSRGIFDEQFSFRLYDKLKDLVKRHKAKQVIFLGDVKEDITMLDVKTREVLTKLGELCEITIIRGNHDGGIEEFLHADIKPSEGFVFEKLGLLHGHSWPEKDLLKCDYLVMGHQHPMISFTDKMGKKHKEAVWIIADPNEDEIKKHYEKFNRKIKLILIPAFNPLVGFPINLSKGERLGPILNTKLFKLDHALVFRLDGTGLGKLKDITFHKS